ncbi:MAG: TolC family protein [Rhodobiaceae bacterium]|nr:TolC family protein [Rhodobiaceae bacterium]
MYPIGVHSRQLRLALTVAVLALVAGGCTNTRVHTGSLAASGNDPCASQQHPGAEIDCAALASYGSRDATQPLVRTAPAKPTARQLAAVSELRTSQETAQASRADLDAVAAAGRMKTPYEAARASPATTGSVQQASVRRGGAMSLREAIGLAVHQNPEIGYAEARAYDAYYGIKVGQSALLPRIDGSVGAGFNAKGTYTSDRHQPYAHGDTFGRGAFDASLTLKQLLYDFGSARAEIDRNKLIYVTEAFKRQAKIEEIVYETVKAYLTMIEQQSLLDAARQNLKAHEEFERLVKLNEANGNGTAADVSRVEARKVDAQTLLTDIEANSEDAADRFRRLTRVAPGRLAEPPNIARSVPPNVGAAIAMLPERNAELLGLQANAAAMRMELASHNAKGMPSINLEVEGLTNTYMDTGAESDVEVKGMVVMRHRLYDGGKRHNEALQIETRVRQFEYRHRQQMDDLEADLRQYYRAISSSKSKVSDLEKGLASSRKVRELYTEQFRAGERTVFELLDSQTSLYSDQRDLISNKYDALRSQFRILHAVGLLSQTVFGVDAKIPEVAVKY